MSAIEYHKGKVKCDTLLVGRIGRLLSSAPPVEPAGFWEHQNIAIYLLINYLVEPRVEWRVVSAIRRCDAWL